MIKPYLRDIINDHKTVGLLRYNSSNKTWAENTSSKWYIQLKIAINLISSKDSDETGTTYLKSNNVDIMMDGKTDEITAELFESFLQKYQEGLEESMRGSELAYDSIGAIYYNLIKESLSRRG